MVDFDSDETLRQHLLHEFEKHRIEPIRGPDANGAFPGSWVEQFYRPSPLLVVPDTMILLGDIGRAARDDKRSMLVTAANSGALRLFCAQHVQNEVLGHSAEWADRFKITQGAFVERWRSDYQPLLRSIGGSDLSREMFSPFELNRYDAVVASGSKDAPSVLLAKALGAYYLTKDQDARFAVYGHRVPPSVLEGWLTDVRTGGEADDQARIYMAMLLPPTVALVGGWHIVKAAYKKSPWLLLAIIAVAGGLAIATPPETYRTIGSVALQVGSFALEANTRAQKAREHFESMMPTVPSWSDLAATNSRRNVLARACLYHLARSVKNPLSIQEVVDVLPDVGVGQSEKPVREAMRKQMCFFRPTSSTWQVGRPFGWTSSE